MFVGSGELGTALGVRAEGKQFRRAVQQREDAGRDEAPSLGHGSGRAALRRERRERAGDERGEQRGCQNRARFGKHQRLEHHGPEHDDRRDQRREDHARLQVADRVDIVDEASNPLAPAQPGRAHRPESHEGIP